MPGTHRTPPDAEYQPVRITTFADSDDVIVHGGRMTPKDVAESVAALAAHLTVDARRALTRDLAAQDGDAVVEVDDAAAGAWFLRGMAGADAGAHRLKATAARLHAAAEAVRPTPTPEETNRG